MQLPGVLFKPNPEIKKLYLEKFLIFSEKSAYPENFLYFWNKA